MRQKEETIDHRRRKLTAEIRKLYLRGKPLNLSWIRRNRPELLRAVYGVKPFWGWKRALEDAGINYSDIKIELDEFCECRICGASVVHLGNHVFLSHGIEPEEYHEDYPDEDLNSDVLRAAKSRMECKALAHWELLWTPEYLLDRVAEIHRRGMPVNSAWVQHNDNAMAHAAVRYFKNWSNVLRFVGIDPGRATKEAYLRMRAYPDGKAVCGEIRRRHRAGLPICSGGVRNGMMRGVKNLLRLNGAEKRAVEESRKRLDQRLWYSAEEYFGSWDKALSAAGFDPANVRRNARHVRYRTKNAVVAEVRRRHRQRLPLKVAAILKAGHADSALIVEARKLFGSWRACLKAAGVPVPATVYTMRPGPKPRRN